MLTSVDDEFLDAKLAKDVLILLEATRGLAEKLEFHGVKIIQKEWFQLYSENRESTFRPSFFRPHLN